MRIVGNTSPKLGGKRWSVAEKFDGSCACEFERLHSQGRLGDIWRCTALGALVYIESLGEALRWLSLGSNVYADVYGRGIDE